MSELFQLEGTGTVYNFLFYAILAATSGFSYMSIFLNKYPQRVIFFKESSSTRHIFEKLTKRLLWVVFFNCYAVNLHIKEISIYTCKVHEITYHNLAHI